MKRRWRFCLVRHVPNEFQTHDYTLYVDLRREDVASEIEIIGKDGEDDTKRWRCKVIDKIAYKSTFPPLTQLIRRVFIKNRFVHIEVSYDEVSPIVAY